MSHGVTPITRIAILVFLVAHTTFAQVSTQYLARMDAVINEEIANKKLPGAVVVAGRKGRVVWRKSYGARVVDPMREVMTPDTIFDVASLTKVVATATSIMILV